MSILYINGFKASLWKWWKNLQLLSIWVWQIGKIWGKFNRKNQPYFAMFYLGRIWYIKCNIFSCELTLRRIDIFKYNILFHCLFFSFYWWALLFSACIWAFIEPSDHKIDLIFQVCRMKVPTWKRLFFKKFLLHFIQIQLKNTIKKLVKIDSK